MISITEKQFFEFLNCSLHYNAIYGLKIANTNHPTFSTFMQQVTNSFFWNLMNGKVLSTGELKTKWDSVCEKNQSYITQQRCIDGMTLLLKFYHWAQDKQLRIVDMKIPYRIIFRGDKEDVEFTGEVGTVAVINSSTPELLVLDFGTHYPDQAIVDMKLKYTLDWFAFKELYKTEFSGIHVHHVKSNRDFFSFRNEDDMKRLKATIDNTAYAIDKKIFIPRESTFCSSCDMKLYCNAWRG